MSIVKVDAMGDACPIPVVKAKKALGEMKEPGTLEVHVDNEIAVQNLSRLASGSGLQSASEKAGEGHFIVRMQVTGPVEGNGEAISCAPDMRGDYVIAIGSEYMGCGDDTLGATLMKGFIYAVTQLDKLPSAMLFYNGGAKLTVEGAVSVEDLKGLEAQGVEILTCGTCLNFYGLSDKLAVGSVTNMYSIVEKLAGAGKVIKP